VGEDLLHDLVGQRGGLDPLTARCFFHGIGPSVATVLVRRPSGTTAATAGVQAPNRDTGNNCGG
jgi:hypothetical protein